MTIDDNILDDPFHACAFAAFIQQARIEQGWPDPEKTRQRAYDLFERRKTQADSAVPPDG